MVRSPNAVGQFQLPGRWKDPAMSEMCVGPGWRRSRHCGESMSCVEVREIGREIAVRDCADPGTVLVFSRGEWDAFLRGVRAGEFDLH
jgi:hypothetical protein